jgi:hypothetical protein
MFELVEPEKIILEEIGNKSLRQIDIAQTYGLILRQDTEVDWGKINKAIIGRWSWAGLKKIKTLAWSGKCYL